MSRPYYGYESTYGFDRERITYAVQRLILACAAVFAAQLLLDIPFGRPGVPLGGLPAWLLAFRPEISVGLLWQPITYVFLHGDLSHLFFNMLWFYIFGPEVERALGTRQFFRFFLISGALGVLVNLLPIPLIANNYAPVIGASGAVMAVLVAHAVINPERELFIFPLAVPLNVRGLIIIVIAFNLIMAVFGAGVTSVGTHLGGMAAGYAYMKLVPRMRTWRFRRPARRPRPRGAAPGRSSDTRDPLGEAVDNIFRFEDEKRRRE